MLFRITLFYCLVSISVVSHAQPSEAQYIQQLRQTILEQDIKMSQLQREIQMLRGDNEVLSHRLEAIKQQQQAIFLDLDERIRQLQTSPSSQTTLPQVPEEPKELTEIAVPTLEITPEIDNEIAETPSLPEKQVPPITKSEVAERQPIVQPLSMAPPVNNEDNSAYDRGIQLVQQRQYRQAAEQFKQFLQRYPNSDYADNAQYWLGESFYAVKDFDSALVAFNTVLKNYPQSPKYAHALLKIGYVYYEQGKYQPARTTFEQLAASYPNTATAHLAKRRLDKMNQEGL